MDYRISVTSLITTRQRGSSMVEFFTSLLVFVPLFIGIPLLGKYADIKHQTIEASRYVAWERTVYSEPGVSMRNDSWRDSGGGVHLEAEKSSAQIMVEAEQRMFGHPSQGLHNGEITPNPFWVNRKGESLLALAASEDPNDPNRPAEGNQFLSGNMGQSGVTDHIGGLSNATAVSVQALATGGGEFAGIFGDGDGAGDISDGAQDGFGQVGGLLGGGGIFSDDGCGFPGINLAQGIGLGSNAYTEIDVNTPVINFMKINEESPDLNFRARAAVLSNAWTVPSEAKFQERLDNAVPNQFLGCITLPGRYTFGLLSNPFSSGAGPIFGEGKLSYPVRIQEAPSTTLPTELQYYDETR